jgi:hypothetical protein
LFWHRHERRCRAGARPARPSRLVAGPTPRSVVVVKVHVKQDQVAPMRIVLELGRAPIRPAVALWPCGRTCPPAGARSLGPLRTGSWCCWNRWDTRLLSHRRRIDTG